jgi:hypothetical protein
MSFRTLLTDLRARLRQPGWGRVAAPLALVVIFLPWLSICWDNYSHGLLYRDTPMFLYVAWCVRHGERLYDTVAMPDGPFACLVHMLLQLLAGGSGDGPIRRADFLLHAMAGAGMGALLVPRRVERPVVARVVWAAVGSALWLANLLHWGFTASTQRESYYVLFTCLGMVAWFASPDFGPRGSRIALVLGGFLLALPVFGKQTMAAFVPFAVLGLVLDPGGRPRRERLKLAGVGLGACAIAVLGFVAAFGSLRGYWFWSFDYVSTYYRFHDRKLVADVVAGMPREVVSAALICVCGGLVAMARGLVPLRAIGFVVAPALALVVAVVQQKGWNYHFVPACALTEVLMLLVVVRAWFHHDEASPRWASLLAVVVFGYVGLHFLEWLQTSYWLERKMRHEDDAELLGARSAGAFIKSHSDPSARIFYYGHLIEIPLYAERRPATPYIVHWLYVGGEARLDWFPLTPRQRADIMAMRAPLVNDLCSRLGKRPEIIAMSDGWCVDKDCIKELGTICPDLPKMIESDYQPAVSFDTHRVFLAKGSAPGH